ncbi:flagellar hook-length control protein FliK [Marinomonas rhodophyticola]|uniref:Flagellar hook-length control protein FliK n=1 Tax=Marinomonas rhodophyticola TaxID=2992803 RepID=A0ABT3KFS0_9GAMM|nr:flagellar hook-length control protein FliK [Marinomonas sp. KJ51-3]MCW4629375.1 flagellar hook-length control protein FliK [Marinomonas sp. KJ51-3]
MVRLYPMGAPAAPATESSSVKTSAVAAEASPTEASSSVAAEASAAEASSPIAAEASSTEVSLVKPTSSSSIETSPVVNGESKVANSALTSSSDETVVVTNSSIKGGKDLQLDGENLPTKSSMVSAQSQVEPPVELKTNLKEGANVTASLQLGDGSTEAVGSMAKENKVADQAGVLSTLGGTAGMLMNSTNKQVASVPLDKANMPLVDADNSVPDTSLEQDNGELSWVLSQMDASALKAVPKEAAESAVLDVGKTASAALAAGVLVNAANKESRVDVVPSALLGSATDAPLSSEVVTDSAETLLGEDGVLINEPIELRKKEQEAMIGRMSAQLDGKAIDDATGGLNSSLQNNVNRAAVGVAAATVVAQNPQQNLAMSVPPGHPGWAGEMTQKVAWIARDGGHTAHIRLDPPELGSLTVKISVDSDSNTQVSFIAATPQARDLLEGQMARLREMLAQQGMDLSRADVDVSQQDTSGAQERGGYRNSGVNQGGLVANEDLDNELVANHVSYVSASGIDYYA